MVFSPAIGRELPVLNSTVGANSIRPLSGPNRLIVNEDRPESNIILRADPKDPNIKYRVKPLLVRAGIDAFPGASEMSTEEWFRHYDLVLDSVC